MGQRRRIRDSYLAYNSTTTKEYFRKFDILDQDTMADVDNCRTINAFYKTFTSDQHKCSKKYTPCVPPLDKDWSWWILFLNQKPESQLEKFIMEEALSPG